MKFSTIIELILDMPSWYILQVTTSSAVVDSYRRPTTAIRYMETEKVADLVDRSNGGRI